LTGFFFSIILALIGEDVIATGRRMMGATKPKDSAPGTIRGDLAVNMGRNIIHGTLRNIIFLEHSLVTDANITNGKF